MGDVATTVIGIIPMGMIIGPVPAIITTIPRTIPPCIPWIEPWVKPWIIPCTYIPRVPPGVTPIGPISPSVTIIPWVIETVPSAHTVAIGIVFYGFYPTLQISQTDGVYQR